MFLVRKNLRIQTCLWFFQYDRLVSYVRIKFFTGGVEVAVSSLSARSPLKPFKHEIKMHKKNNYFLSPLPPHFNSFL